MASATVATHVTHDELALPTPCAGWSVRDLLAHMTAQHIGFAAAARGDGADPSGWLTQPLGTDPVSEYIAASEKVVVAFAEAGVMQRRFTLPEISADTPFRAAQAISFHFVDYVVHGWDLAVAIGAAFTLDDDLLRAALEVAERVPGGAARLRPDAAFAPSRPTSGGSTLDEILALLGRSPSWPA
ncbi:MAG: hypothetical protein JWO57_2445 [Pseudonocardiales bacterium]|nr:hypothetical protein [Pseudonocardiales bacterium]